VIIALIVDVVSIADDEDSSADDDVSPDELALEEVDESLS
jgi:hypothetical protein